MSQSDSSSITPRRQFIGELAAGAAALAAVACAPAATATTGTQAPAPTPAPTQAPSTAARTAPTTPPLPIPPQTWDVSWTQRITAKHKVVFDSPEIEEGTALYHAVSYLQSVKDVFGTGDSDASVVVILRHAAVPLLYNDAMWEKYNIGAATKTLDSKTKEPVKRNIYYQRLDAQGKPIEDRPTPTIRSLTNRGVIFVGCDLATRGFARRFAEPTKQEMRDVYAELKANLVPGASLLTTGVFAMLLAQEAGCSFMKAT